VERFQVTITVHKVHIDVGIRPMRGMYFGNFNAHGDNRYNLSEVEEKDDCGRITKFSSVSAEASS
jgi:hypothetical protein